MSLVLALLLAAAPPSPVLEPTPPKGAERLHPRSITASSFLRDGWNRFDENYLPPYAADDDAATAWVEGVDGQGVGESLLWLGPQLRESGSWSVWIRNGFQKSVKLHAANSRPRRIRLEPVTHTELGVSPAGAARELELADVLGWQEVTLTPDKRVAGFRLTVLSVYPGTKYQDTCVSDVRVYAQAEDPHRPAAENMAAESIRRFVAERKQAAKLGGWSAGIRVAAAYQRASHEELALGKSGWGEAIAAERTALREVARRAERAARLLEGVDALSDTAIPEGWTQVTVKAKPAQVETARVAFARVEPSLAALTQYFVAADLGLSRARPEALAKEARAKREREEKRRKEALEACVTGCLADVTPEGDEAACPVYCDEEHPALGESWSVVAVRGSLAKPEAIALASAAEQGERTPSLVTERSLLALREGLADAIALSREYEDEEGEPERSLSVLVPELKAGADGKLELVALIRFEARGDRLRVTRFEAVS